MFTLLRAALLGAAAQAPESGVTVTGVVEDQTGAVLAGASVELVNGAGAVAQSAWVSGTLLYSTRS